MKKTFREVIRDIKQGEEWVCVDERWAVKRVKYDSAKGLRIYHNSAFNDAVYIGEDVAFELKRRQHTFIEAFAEYEKGAVIESVNSGNIYDLQHGGCDCRNDCKTDVIKFDEIRGMWYINR